MRTTIIVKRSDRLIARLKQALYAWRFADQVQGRVVVMWPPPPATQFHLYGPEYSPSRLFDLRRFYADGGADSLVFLEGSTPFPPPEERRSLQDAEFASMRPNKFDRDFFLREAPLLHEIFAPIFVFKDEPRGREYSEHMRRTLRNVYQRLPLDPLIKRTLDRIKESFGDGYVVVHVRRGDVMEMLRVELPRLANGVLQPDRLALILAHYVTRTALDEFYYPEIDAAIKSKRRIVYFSDTPGTISHFTEKFGARHFYDGERIRGRYPIQKAFTDFNLMIGAEKIISTASNFASLAAVLGTGESVNVAAIGTLDRLEQHLHEAYLSNVDIGPTGRQLLRAELESQYLRFSKGRPLPQTPPSEQPRPTNRPLQLKAAATSPS
jgi:hypothetical protein